jgi:oxygen-independent coproporphyrinogen-3 oxidase
LLPDFWERAGFGLYIHWPFCQAKCPYCDFNSHVSANIDQNRWKSAFLSEIRRVAELVPDRTVSTIFFGGGTPSLMDPDLVFAIIDEARAVWPTANDPEITLEANPTSVEAGRFRAYRDAGVSRISMGIQALNDTDLRRLGRLHSVSEALSAYDVARAAFDRISFDLMYGRQDQTLEAWKDELLTALSLAVDHLSLYQLTIEAGTAFGDRFRHGRLKGLPDEDLSAELYELTQELCDAAGMPAYEISNHAAPGSESRHNLIYWRSGDYAGIGPGAHGRLTINGQRVATETPLAPQAWLRSVEATGDGEASAESISPDDHLKEFALMGLRLTEGVPLDPFTKHENLYKNINGLADIGLLSIAGGRVSATNSGRPVLNALLREIFA